MTAEEQTRRLITLICAGRNRMVMIRRELPRTKCAGWGRSPFRIETDEGSPSRGSCTVIGAAVQKCILVSISGGGFLSLFRFCCNGPDEAQQFAPQCCYDLILVLAAGREGLVSLMQSLLRFPGNLLHLLTER